MRLVFCFVFPLNQTVIASTYFRCCLYASPYTRAFTSYSLQTTPFAFPKASLLVWHTSKPRSGCLPQCFVSCETYEAPQGKACFTWNIITTFTQSHFFKVAMHKARLLLLNPLGICYPPCHPDICGLSYCITLSTSAQCASTAGRRASNHVKTRLGYLYGNTLLAAYRVTYHTLGISTLRLMYVCVTP